jgi:hypothetical protein
MKKLIIILILTAFGKTLFAQDQAVAECYKDNRLINYFIKSVPQGDYEVIGEMKVSGAGKTTQNAAALLGAAGFNHVNEVINEFNKKVVLKKAKKGIKVHYDGVIVDKPKFAVFVKLTEAPSGTVGAKAIAQAEPKTGKLVFYMSRPLASYSVVSEITYNQGGLGETMRGGNQMDVAINGMLDKGKRWVKRGKIESDFDALVIDPSAILRGQVKGELIKFN